MAAWGRGTVCRDGTELDLLGWVDRCVSGFSYPESPKLECPHPLPNSGIAGPCFRQMLILCWALVMLQTASPILSWLKRVSLGWLESGSGFRSTLGQGPLEHILGPSSNECRAGSGGGEVGDG